MARVRGWGLCMMRSPLKPHINTCWCQSNKWGALLDGYCIRGSCTLMRWSYSLHLGQDTSWPWHWEHWWLSALWILMSRYKHDTAEMKYPVKVCDFTPHVLWPLHPKIWETGRYIYTPQPSSYQTWVHTNVVLKSCREEVMSWRCCRTSKTHHVNSFSCLCLPWVSMFKVD